MLLIAALVVLQIHLTRRFHRVFNPGLIAATLCAAVAVVSAAQLLTITHDRMKVARRDSFDSVIALSRSKAIGYDANADESRYLLDPDRRAAYELSFLDKSHQLYGIQGAGLDTYDRKLADTWATYRNNHEDKTFTGEYRRELDNITFAGSGKPPRRPSRRMPSTSATTGPSGGWWPKESSRRRRSSASAGRRTPRTPTSGSG